MYDEEKLVIIEKCLDPLAENPEEDFLMETKISVPIWMFHDLQEAQTMLHEALEGNDEFSLLCNQIVNEIITSNGTANNTENDRIFGFLWNTAVEVVKTAAQEMLCTGGASGK